MCMVPLELTLVLHKNCWFWPQLRNMLSKVHCKRAAKGSLMGEDSALDRGPKRVATAGVEFLVGEQAPKVFLRGGVHVGVREVPLRGLDHELVHQVARTLAV